MNIYCQIHILDYCLPWLNIGSIPHTVLYSCEITSALKWHKIIPKDRKMYSQYIVNEGERRSKWDNSK